MFVVLGINTVISDHFEMLFRNMNDKHFNKINSRHGFSNESIILMSVVVKGNIRAVIIIDARCSNDRSSQISSNIF